MKSQHLAEDSRHQNISNPTKEYRRNDLAMIFDGIALMCKQNHLPIPSRFGVNEKGESEVMENRMKTLMIVDLCQSLSFLVRWEMETQNTFATNTSRHDVRDDGDDVYCDDGSRARMIIDLSRVIMEFLDTENALNLSPEEIDRMVLGCLLDTYRIPSIVNNFETETIGFYEWWRRRIKDWIGGPYSKNQSGGCYQRLGWRHLAAMIRETRDQLRPPPLSIVVNGAGSKDVNGEYKLVGESSLPVVTVGLQRQEKQEPCYRFYGNRNVSYEKTTMDGRTFSLCLCGVNQSPTSQGGTGHSLWFLTELDEEQPNTDCDIDYYCALPRNGNCRRTNPVPPLQEWKRCSHGLFPSPKLVLSDVKGDVGGAASDIHWQCLARWMLEEDVLAKCCWWSTHKPRDDDADSALSFVMEFLMEIYEEQGRSNLGETAGSSLGTELLVKFAASCIQEQTKRTKY